MKPFETLASFVMDGKNWVVIDRFRTGREITCIYIQVAETVAEYEELRKVNFNESATPLYFLQAMRRAGVITNYRNPNQ